MVIQCSACDTRFKIADDKVKPGGVKVRCSKCKEVFTVLPPEDEQSAAAAEPSLAETAGAEPSSGDWGALNSSFSESTPETGSGLNDVDWDSLNSDDSAVDAAESTEASAAVASTDFSFGDEDDADAGSDNFSFDDEEDSSAVSTDDFSFGDEDDGLADSDDSADSFSFGGDAATADESLGFNEPVGEGAQDEFSFDDGPAAADDADDFDWDGGGSADAGDASSDFGFNASEQATDSLDFSSLEMSEEEEEPALEIETPQVDSAPAREAVRPAAVKGPQRSGVKGRGTKTGRTTRKKSGPLRGILTLLVLLSLIVGGGLYGLMQMGFWTGNFEELPNVDYAAAGQTAWNKAVMQFDKLIGNETVQQPAGSITVTEMSGKYVENSSAGVLFVIEGTVRNDFTASRSAIAVRGTLYDTAGVPVQQQKVYCGNKLDSNALRTETLAALQARGKNEFGDSLSNLDVAPGALLPFTIVFDNLPKNLSEYNVVASDSAAGSKP